MSSFYEELEKRGEELGMAREEMALYAAKRQGSLRWRITAGFRTR